MSFDTIIRNGSLVTATDTYTADVAIANGKIAESWNVWDTLGLLQQLGVVPALASQ